MKKTIVTMGVLALLIGTATAQQTTKTECTAEHKAEMRHGQRGDMMADIPNLTEEQTASLKQIREEGQKDMKPQREKMRAMKEKLNSMKTTENPNMSEINQLIDESHRLEAEIDKSRTAQHIKMRSVLTAEQRTVFDAKMKEKREKHVEMRKEHRELKQAK